MCVCVCVCVCMRAREYVWLPCVCHARVEWGEYGCLSVCNMCACVCVRVCGGAHTSINTNLG